MSLNKVKGFLRNWNSAYMNFKAEKKKISNEKIAENLFTAILF